MYEPYDWEIEAEVEERSYQYSLRTTGASDKTDNWYIVFVLVLLFVITPLVAFLVGSPIGVSR